MMQRIGKFIFDLIDENSTTRQSIILNSAIIILIIANVIAIVLESFLPIKTTYAVQLQIFEYFSVFFFTLEYLLRLISSIEKFKKPILRSFLSYFWSINATIDLLAIIPFYLPLLIPMDLRYLRILRLLRIVRIFKLHRYAATIKIFTSVFKKKRQELLVTL